MLLHLLINEKVTRRTIYLFEAIFPQQNYFVCTREGLCGSIQKEDPIVYYVNGHLTENIDFDKIKAVLIHYLTPESISFVDKYIPEGVPVYWFMWGGDFYPLLGDKGYGFYSQPIFAGKRYLFKSYILSKKFLAGKSTVQYLVICELFISEFVVIFSFLNLSS